MTLSVRCVSRGLVVLLAYMCAKTSQTVCFDMQFIPCQSHLSIKLLNTNEKIQFCSSSGHGASGQWPRT